MILQYDFPKIYSYQQKGFWTAPNNMPIRRSAYEDNADSENETEETSKILKLVEQSVPWY